MQNMRLAGRARFGIGLAFFLGGLSAAPAGNAQAPTPPAPASAVVPLTGKITQITILGTKNIPADTVRAVLTQKRGDPYRPEAADKDRAAIQGLGVFQKTVGVSATAAPGGVALTYTVAENPIIKGIRFTANTPSKEPTIPAVTLLAQMKTRVGQVLDTNTLVSDLAALFKHDSGYVSKQGYIFDVSSDLNIDPATGVLTIPLVEAHIQSIQVTGNRRVKTADILAQMRAKPGDVYDAPVIHKDLEAIYGMGGFQQVGGDTLAETAPGRITITIPVIESAPAVPGSLDEAQGRTVPFLYDAFIVPLPVVQVSINGQPALPFIVDTGTAAPLILDPWAVARLGLKGKEQTRKSGDGNSYAAVPLQGAVFEGANRGGDISFAISQAQVLDLGFLIGAVGGRHVAGIVGLGMLSPITTRFDFAAKTLTFFSSPHPPLHPPGATVLPLRRTSDGLYTVAVTLAPDTAADLILDTGSTSTQVPLTVVGALHPTAASYGHGVEQIGGLYVCPDLRLPGLGLGPLRVPDVVVSALPLARTSLGMNVLDGYRLTLDGPNAQLALEPLAVGRRPLQGLSGLDLAQTGQALSVIGLAAGEPAERAGVRVGDEIVAVNGQTTQQLPPARLTTLLMALAVAPPGTLFRLSLRRGKSATEMGKALDVSWTSLDEFSAPRNALDGLLLKKANAGPWVIVSALKGCPGEQAGLQVGDEITRMAGALVAGMSPDQVMTLLRHLPDPLTLTVTRAGRAAPLSVKLSAPAP